MHIYNVDPRDGFRAGGACNTCCCVPIVVHPGEIEQVKLNYAGWVLPMGGRGLSVNTVITIEKTIVPEPSGGNQRVTLDVYEDDTLINTPLASTLATSAHDPDADTLHFRLEGLYGPNNGEIIINDVGTFTYTPNPGFEGVDRFWWSVSDEHNPRVVQEAIISVGTSPAATPRDVIVIPNRRRQIDTTWQTLTFAVDVAPSAVLGDIYRVNVRQQALDCDCNPYYHVSCWDFIIGKC